MLVTYGELTCAGVPTRQAAQLTGVPRASAARAKTAKESTPKPASARIPINKLDCVEETRVLALLNSAEFVDKAPLQIYAILLERGEYVCSVSTMYRLLRRAGLVRERRRMAKHPPRKVPELVATGPGQVYSWDITRLPGPSKGIYYHAYVMIDIFSRYIVGAVVHNREVDVLAKEMMIEAFAISGVPQIVHSDGGAAMMSKTVATLLADLGITRSRSRPRVSNDNPYSESNFKTMKYLPEFPDRFNSLNHAREFMTQFVENYNHHHRHTGIGLHTPADVQYGLADQVDKRRTEALMAAYANHPERFAKTPNPKILQREEIVWINEPKNDQETINNATLVTVN